MSGSFGRAPRVGPGIFVPLIGAHEQGKLERGKKRTQRVQEASEFEAYKVRTSFQAKPPQEEPLTRFGSEHRIERFGPGTNYLSEFERVRAERPASLKDRVSRTIEAARTASGKILPATDLDKKESEDK